MRISDRMIVNHTLTHIRQGRQRLGEAQTRVATGRRLRRSSDDPASVERAMSLARELRMSENQLSNLQISQDWLMSSEETLAGMSDLVISIKNTALKALNDTQGETERDALAHEATAIFENALSIANAKHGDNYLFSGQQIKTKPFELDNGSIIYAGDNATMRHMVETGQTMPVNITGVEGQSGGLLFTLNQMHELATALSDGDMDTVENITANLDNASDDLNAAISTLGARMQRVNRTVEQMEDRQVSLKELYSNLVDADMAETIAEMNAEEQAYEMSLAAASRVMPRSLLDFLR